MNIEVGDLVRCRDDRHGNVWIVSEVHDTYLLLGLQDEPLNGFFYIEPVGVCVVYTFFDLCRAWEDAIDRDWWNYWNYFDQIWGKDGDEFWHIWDQYGSFAAFTGPLPRHLAYLYSWTTER